MWPVDSRALVPPPMEGSDAQKFGVWSLRRKGCGRQFWSVRCRLGDDTLRAALSRAADSNEQLGLGYEVHASSFTLRWSPALADGATASQLAVLRASTEAAEAAVPAPPATSLPRPCTRASAAARPNRQLAKHALRHAKWLVLQDGLRGVMGHTPIEPPSVCELCLEALLRNGPI